MKKGADNPRLVGDPFNRQRNLHMRLVQGGLKTSRSHVPARILKVYMKAISGFSHIFTPDGLNSALLSQGHVLETACLYGNSKQDILLKDWGGREEPLIADRKSVV